jgi:carboxylesterase
MNEKQLKSDNLPLPRTLASSKSIILRAKQQSSKAALLLHGMTSSPYELEEVGLALHKQGFDVFIPCLSGHGDTIERLKLTPTSDWTEDAVSSREYLFDCGYESVAMLGQSFGGLLALYAMANSKPREGDKLVVMAVPMQLRSSLREYLLLTLSYLPEPLQDKLGLVDKKTPQDETAFAKERKAFRQHSIGANARMIKIRRQLLPRLKNISCPVFLLAGSSRSSCLRTSTISIEKVLHRY